MSDATASAAAVHASDAPATMYPAVSGLSACNSCRNSGAIHHSAGQLASVLPVGLHILDRVDRASSGRGSFAEDRLAGRPPGQRRFGGSDAARHRLDPAEADPWRSNGAAFHAQHNQGHRQRIITRPATELLKAETGTVRQDRQPGLGKQLVGREHRCHGAPEEVSRSKAPLAASAVSNQLGVQGRRHEAPFCRRIGMRQAAAERAA